MNQFLSLLAYDIKETGFLVAQQETMPRIFNKITMDFDNRIDSLVNPKIVIEVKALETLTLVQYAQLVTYFKVIVVKLGY
ncbi:MAG: GxxExxY protein [Bacteroidota bacterium]